MDQEEITFAQFMDARLKERNLNLKKLSEISGIAIRHLENLHTGNFRDLPSAPYTRGYLKRLAPILGFDADGWWEKIKDDGVIKNAGEADALPKNRFAKRLPRKTIFLALGAILMLIYVIVRFSFITGEPTITVNSPAQNPATVTTNEITIAGTVKNGDELYLDGEAVPIAQDGSWQKIIMLTPNLNSIKITAKKLLGKETNLVQQIIYTPPAPVSVSSTPSR